jgi:hypothetical protein
VADRGPELCQPSSWIGSDTGSASNHFAIDSRLPAWHDRTSSADSGTCVRGLSVGQVMGPVAQLYTLPLRKHRLARAKSD